MAQRHMCPSMGLLRRTLAADISAKSINPTRSFSSSATRLTDASSDGGPSKPAPTNPPTRRARSEIALRQITNLQNRRIQPGGPARGNFPSGQTARQPPRDFNGTGSGFPTAGSNARNAPTASPRLVKYTPRSTSTPGSAPPEGARMVRPPARLNMNRNPNATVGSARGGPNLRGRAGDRGAPRGDRGPKQREKIKGSTGSAQPRTLAEIDPATTLSDGMVRNLLRLQRKDWDRIPYEPKYALGSFAAQALIHEGRELFRGEAPPIKIWGKLEKRIGVVGMFGAEAHLQVRRVPDGDDAPFGQEDAQDVEAEAAAEGEKQGSAIQ